MKKCKGITAETKGFGCGKEMPAQHRVYGLGKTCGCYRNWLLNTKPGQEKINRSSLKAKKIQEKKSKQEFKAKKEALINYRERLQRTIQEIARLIDIGLPCLARGYHPNQMHGGHIFSKGHNKSIALNLHNIHRQSAQSNYKHNEDGLLREKLIAEYGSEYYDFISQLRRSPDLKRHNWEYKEMYLRARKIAKELKAQGMRLNKEERILMRNLVNKRIGIYDESLGYFDPKTDQFIQATIRFWRIDWIRELMEINSK